MKLRDKAKSKKAIRHLRKKALKLPLGGAGEYRAVPTPSYDIADREQVEEALHRQMRFLQELIDSIPVPVFYKDRNGRYLGCNKAWESSAGIPRDETIGKSVRDMCPKERADRHRQIDEALLKEGVGATRTYEIRAKRADGAMRDVQLNKTTFSNPDGSVGGIVGAILDITDLKRAEGQIRQAHKMEALGRLAGGVAHDFRNQLTVIKGFGEMLLRRSLVKQEGLDKVREILKAAEGSLLLTGQLLTFSRKEAVRTQVVDLVGLMEDLRKTIPRLIGEDIRLHLVQSPRECLVEIDPRLFQEAILNLVANARDAMPHGGELIIETRIAAPEDDVAKRHPELKPGAYATVTLTDTGCGMDEKRLSRLFEPFSTTKPEGEGTGLGLAMVYKFVKQSVGAIEVQSRRGKGSVFRLYFPLTRRAARTSKGAAAVDRLPRGKETILLVEDEAPVRKALAESLREAGYTIIEACDAQEALSLTERHGASIDALMTDVVMSGASGTELARRITRQRPHIPVLFISGYADEELSRRGVDPVRVHHLPKPCSHEVLVKTVRRALDSAGKRPTCLTAQAATQA